MKKEQIIKSMLFLIIPLFAISCDGNGFMEYEETALMQRDAQQGLLSDGASDNICMVNLNLFTKPYFDYQYNTLQPFKILLPQRCPYFTSLS